MTLKILLGHTIIRMLFFVRHLAGPQLMFRAFLLTGLVGFWFITSSPVMAASTLTYSVKQGGHKAVQTVNIQDGQVWITHAGGDSKTDVLFDRATDQWVLIDHRNQSYTPVNEETVRKLSAQIEDMLPLVQGLGDQIRRLNPQQRAKWEKMLNGFPLDAFDQARQEIKASHLKPKGKAQTIAGVRCETMQLRAGHVGDLEFCLAKPEALGLTAEDAETLQALTSFTQRLAQKAHGLASRFGLAIAQSDLNKLAGIPIMLRNTKGQHPLSMTLDHAEKITTPLKPLQIPENYQPQKLRLW